jgi:hypothetical protein
MPYGVLTDPGMGVNASGSANAGTVQTADGEGDGVSAMRSPTVAAGEMMGADGDVAGATEAGGVLGAAVGMAGATEAGGVLGVIVAALSQPNTANAVNSAHIRRATRCRSCKVCFM